MKTGGSHFGILTFASYNDVKEREMLMEEGVKGWQELSFHAKELGYEGLIIEPMSIPREMANTVEDTLELMERVNANCGVVLESLEKSGAKEALLIFEISHREHRDSDSRIIQDLKASVDYWRPYVKEVKGHSSADVGHPC